MAQPANADDESASELPLGLPLEQGDESTLIRQQSTQPDQVGDHRTLTGTRDHHNPSRRQDTAHPQLLQPSTKLLTSRDLATLQLLPQALDRPGEHLHIVDFNLHHPLWVGHFYRRNTH